MGTGALTITGGQLSGSAGTTFDNSVVVTDTVTTLGTISVTLTGERQSGIQRLASLWVV
ncbi:MAG: hypothetical protein WCL08_10110 [Verrucomicrobiota bacterium]